jgi:hypothetical protein
MGSTAFFVVKISLWNKLVWVLEAIGVVVGSIGILLVD